jgi:ABC-type dipeptide/oligopeptide/nickel transport system permease component
VKDALLRRLPYTVELALYAIFPVVFVGIWLGVKAAVHRGKFLLTLKGILSPLGDWEDVKFAQT